jgi:hypothetical protein
MKNHLFILLFTISTLPIFSQNEEFKEFSFSEFFQMIEEEQDTVFELSDAAIIYNEKTDTIFSFVNAAFNAQNPEKRKDSVIINKELKLTNVLFGTTRDRFTLGFLKNIIFRKDLTLYNSNLRLLQNSDFYGTVRINVTDDIDYQIERLSKQYGQDIIVFNTMGFDHCNFFNGLRYDCNSEEEVNIQFGLTSCEIWPSDNYYGFWVDYDYQNNFWISSCVFHEDGIVFIRPKKGSVLDIDRNNFGNSTVRMLLGNSDIPDLNISKNHFDNYVLGNFSDLINSHFLSWPQFSGKLIDDGQYDHYFFMMNNFGIDSLDGFTYNEERYHKNNVGHYINRVRIENDEAYYTEKKLRSNFYNYFKTNQNTDYANAVYTEIKDLETDRLRYLNRVKPSFDTYFTYKINQFLKIFSAYGTKPSKAIIYSIYVILFFSFIYLFFPNSWDSHGKKRIMNRFRFFTKYMKRDAGFHEVYLEEKKEDLLEYEDFKKYMEASGKSIPPFFLATALPLYRWAVSGTYLSSSFLKRIDVMQGTWEDVPEDKRWWKGILLIGAFIIAIIYDLIIKMLNALMLSINTFTTLGFGEIPIRGLPRYLAIIQGFIGWFMLTIFSVSLISQLLN